jgi:hypothetical protein
MISSKFGKFPVNIRVASLEKPMEAWLQGSSAVVALPAACLVNTGPYRGATLFSILLTGSSVEIKKIEHMVVKNKVTVLRQSAILTTFDTNLRNVDGGLL